MKKMMALLDEIKELHRPIMQSDHEVCDHCSELCHSHSGLMCDDPTDGAWPCETAKIIMKWDWGSAL